MTRRRSLLRDSESGHAPVGYAELFFDLVYVFAVTQLSHYLLTHHTVTGLAQGVVLFLAVWWAWMFMAWATNWLDPDRGPVRAMIFLVMLVSLLMSASLPKAFGAGGLVFALAYLAMQIGRTAFVAWSMRAERPDNAVGMVRAVLWFAASAPLWIWGALASPELRLPIWAAAVAFNYAAPLLGFRVPGLGASSTTSYNVSGGHMAERCALFIIVALGEGVLVTGATFSAMTIDAAAIAAFATAFVSSVATWWIYFDRGMGRGVEHIERENDTGRIARGAYTYLHIPIVAGIIVGAVADEMVLAHPLGHAEPAYVMAAVGGPALFLAGCAAFKKMTGVGPWFPLSHLVGLGLLVALALWAALAHPAPLAIACASAAVLIVVAIWEWGSFHGGWAERAAEHGIPLPEIARKGPAQR